MSDQNQALQVATDTDKQGAVTVKDAIQALEPVQTPKTQTTAAQAKVEAVAALTMKAYERASMLTLTAEEIAGLQADFPDSAFQPGAAGKEHLIYIEHAYLRDRLNQVFGPGQWAIVPRSRWAEEFRTMKGQQASRVYVEAMLLIRGCFVSEAVGEMEYYPNNAGQNYGDAVEGAKTAALRRCCKELGIGLQAWKKEWCEQWWARRRGGRTFQQKPASQPQSETKQQQPEKATVDKETILPVVTVLAVSEKQGTTVKGKPWHAFFVTLDDTFSKAECGTFSATVGKLAQELSQTGETAKAVIKPGNKPGKFELVSLERAEVPPTDPKQSQQPQHDDEPPQDLVP